MATEYIRIPRSALTRDVWGDGDLASLLIFLLSRADDNGLARVDSADLRDAFGWTREQARSRVRRLIATTKTTTLPTTNATTFDFGRQQVKLKRQPPKQPPCQPPCQPPPEPLPPPREASLFDVAQQAAPLARSKMDEAFEAWLDYKYEQFRFRYKTARSRKAAYDELVRLSEGDPDKAIRIVERSMSGGWKGLYELEENETNQQNRSGGRRTESHREFIERSARELASGSTGLITNVSEIL